eukprot:TRINITY_DN51318_c0_g1_i1.p1 TRINITY_DN51318_c0_g1~~TRINITY_DN51318_c0_g1_i1.p1  ORF type:complete len:344 (+),score=64.39 TRINITY_DN51318_c0_g1_i1:138-1169(+)
MVAAAQAAMTSSGWEQDWAACRRPGETLSPEPLTDDVLGMLPSDLEPDEDRTSVAAQWQQSLYPRTASCVSTTSYWASVHASHAAPEAAESDGEAEDEEAQPAVRRTSVQGSTVMGPQRPCGCLPPSARSDEEVRAALAGFEARECAVPFAPFRGGKAASKEKCGRIIDACCGRLLVIDTAADEAPWHIYEGLWLSNWSGILAGETLVERGITHVVRLSEEQDCRVEVLLQRLGVGHTWFPMPDRPGAPILHQFLLEGRALYRKVLSEGGMLCIHCHAGLNRSAALCVAIMVIEHGMDIRQALSLCSAKRGNQILCNRSFRRQLAELCVALDLMEDPHNMSWA